MTRPLGPRSGTPASRAMLPVRRSEAETESPGEIAGARFRDSGP
jgi:hypothetical protein